MNICLLSPIIEIHIFDKSAYDDFELKEKINEDALIFIIAPKFRGKYDLGLETKNIAMDTPLKIG